MRIAVLTVPFITVPRHRALAETCLASLRAQHELDLIAAPTRWRNDEDLAWLKRTFASVITPGENILARAWNIGIDHALERGAEKVLLTNLDILFHHQCIDNLVAFSEKHPEALVWSPHEHPDPRTLEDVPLVEESYAHANFSCCLLDARLFKQVGKFDENFVPAYYEDWDMIYRIKLAGGSFLATRSALIYHVSTGTVKLAAAADDDKVVFEMDSAVKKNCERFIAKWGGAQGKEVFTVPYNKA
jgi:GT2 family glycosyltransferase